MTEFVTTSYRVRLWPGSPLTPEQDARLLGAARLIARAYNTLDPAELIASLSDDATYDSQLLSGPVEGRAEVADYLRARFEAWSKPSSLIEAELGRVDLSEGQRHPCVILSQDDERMALATFTLAPSGRIRSLLICMLVPRPSEAVGLGETPGLDPERQRLRRTEVARFKRAKFAAATGPIVFRCYLARGKKNTLPVERLLRAYPGSRLVRIVDDLDSPAPLADEDCQDRTRFVVIFYPALAVEQGGMVLRPASRSPRYEDVVRDLKAVGRPPVED